MSYEPFSWGVCSICGKKYLKQLGSIYTVKFAGKSYPCCSYNCYNIGVRTKEEIKANRQSKTYQKLMIDAGNQSEKEQ